MIHVGMLLILGFSTLSAHAEVFNHIKLNPHFKEYLTQPKMKSVPEGSEFRQKVRSSLLGAKSFSDPFPGDNTEESPLFAEIRDQLEATHEAMGLAEVSRLDFLNQQFNLGTENFSGFSWQKPFGVVHVLANRQVAPNLFGSNWLVQDTFTFEIEATTFLERSTEAGLTELSQSEIGAFAGITFKRVYTYYHYADSYRNGLRADFSKLFLPFTRFNLRGIEKMSDQEIMKREDQWSARAGGLITTPPLYNLSFSAGILTEFAYEQMVTVQNNGAQDQAAEALRLLVKSKKSASIGETLSLQVDFFNLIKFTLLSQDLTYEYASAKEYTLGWTKPAWQETQSNPVREWELKHILKGFGEVRALEPFVVVMDESDSEALEARGSLLIWGRLKKSNTEQLRIIKDETVRVFYKNYSLSMRVVQNFFSRIFAAVVYKLFEFPSGVKNAALYNREVTLEFEATHPQANDPKVMRIESSEQFSFVLTQSYEVARTDRWIDRKLKDDMIWFVDSFTSLPKDYKSIIRQEQLKGPMVAESHLRVEKAGFDYFNGQSEDQIYFHIRRVCKDFAPCIKTMGKHFVSFRQDYHQNALKPSLVKFKAFLTKYYKKAESMSDLTALFGEENSFIHGQLKAQNSSGSGFVTSFSSGQFRGLGVIDNFKRETGSRMPASIVSE